jgi:hypothetical protein
MSGITSVRFTKLFWDGLEKHRKLKNYDFIRESVVDLILRKTESTGPANGRDKGFPKIKALKGIWHLSISRQNDIVLFYVPQGRELVMGMFGTHHDYPSDGKNLNSAGPTATKVFNAATTPHVASPLWTDAPRWRRPSDITDHPDLPDLAPNALRGLLWALDAELGSGDAYRRLHGIDLLDAGPDALDEWLAETQDAADAVTAALEARPLTGEEYVEALVASGPRR